MAKYVLYFSPEYFEGSLWSKNEAADKAFGYVADYNDLPLSKELKKQLRKFDSDCMNILDWDDPGKGDVRPQSEAEEYYRTGLRLLEMVRAELGDEFEVLDGLEWIRPKGKAENPTE